VKYEVGLFAKDAPFTAACGHFVHVYVSKQTRRPQALSESFIKVLEALS
jgi:acyl-CoA thioester hydrolase